MRIDFPENGQIMGGISATSLYNQSQHSQHILHRTQACGFQRLQNPRIALFGENLSIRQNSKREDTRINIPPEKILQPRRVASKNHRRIGILKPQSRQLINVDLTGPNRS